MIRAAWLRSVPARMDDPIRQQPSSEEAFFANPSLYNTVMPIQMAGRLVASGEWYVEPFRWQNAFGQRLAAYLAEHPEVRLVPQCAIDPKEAHLTVPNRALHYTAATNLRDMALRNGWTAVLLNVEKIPLEYRDHLTALLFELSHRLREAGVELWIMSRGRPSEERVDFDSTYTLDYSIIPKVADVYAVGLGGYWNPLPRTATPYWWQLATLEYTLRCGMSPDKLMIHPTAMAIWTPDPKHPSAKSEIGYAGAQMLLDQAGTDWRWIERNQHGLVRALFADLGERGHLWGYDADALQHRFDLITRYGLIGWSMYTPGLLPEFEVAEAGAA